MNSNTAFINMIQTITNITKTQPPTDPLFIIIDKDTLQDTQLWQELTQKATIIAKLNKEGYLTIQDKYNNEEQGTYLDLALKIAQLTGADPNDPNCQGLICTCPTECDCANHKNGLISNECPIHNKNPQPNPNCPQHGNPN